LIKVAATIAKGIVNPEALTKGSGLTLVFAALVGAIIWNLVTWYFTLPSSSSHALIGGLPIIDTSALWKIIVAAFAGGAGVAVAFGILLLGVSRGQSSDSAGVRTLGYGVALLAGAFCIAAVVLGIHAMTTKS
jgi:hypothetical protein